MEEKFNQPLGGNDMPRFGGPGTMMRLPTAVSAAGLDACFVGIPMDIGASNRSGTRYGPRQIRAESVMIRPYNMATGAAPFESLQVADIGDIAINTFNLPANMEIITRNIGEILKHDCIPLTLGGDHTISYPILKAIAEKHGPVALIHVDAHADINDTMFGEKIAHGTPFRRAYEDGCLNPDLVFQIGLRGTGYASDDFDWSRDKGFTVVPAEECWHKSLVPLIEGIRAKIGNHKTYLTFDIDSLDPAYAPGTGTPVCGGLTSREAISILRQFGGLNLKGFDVVEVSPPYDHAEITALAGASLAACYLCLLAERKAKGFDISL